MKNKKQILKLFSDWGKLQQGQFKDHQNAKLKITALIDSSAMNEQKIKKPVRLVRFGLALGMAVIALFLVTNWLINPMDPISTLKQYSQKSDTNSAREITSLDLGVSYNSNAGSGVLEKKVTNEIAPIANDMIGYYHPTPSVTDTREYLKYYYQANIKTRQVNQIVSWVQTIVRGYGGRVDSSSVNDKNAYISFVVPKKSFELFKNEIESLVGDRFITVSSNSQNLLLNKINIENNTKIASSSLSDYQTQKKTLTDEHNKIVAGYTTQLNYYSGQVWSFQQELKNTTSTVLQTELNKKITTANYQWNYYKKLINDENISYNSKLSILDKNIKTAQNQLINLDKQDVNLNNNVETVEGNITINWVSYWKIIELYIPLYKLLIGGIIITTILFYLYNRQRSFNKV